MTLTTLTDDTFQKDVLESTEPVLVDFWAAWCQPCKMVSPIVDELAGEYEGKLKVAKMDIDAFPKASSQYGILSIPTVMLFKGGKPAAMMIGVQPKSVYKEKIEAALAS
jgi:thioredoxin 1